VYQKHLLCALGTVQSRSFVWSVLCYPVCVHLNITRTDSHRAELCPNGLRRYQIRILKMIVRGASPTLGNPPQWRPAQETPPNLHRNFGTSPQHHNFGHDNFGRGDNFGRPWPPDFPRKKLDGNSPDHYGGPESPATIYPATNFPGTPTSRRGV